MYIGGSEIKSFSPSSQGDNWSYPPLDPSLHRLPFKSSNISCSVFTPSHWKADAHSFFFSLSTTSSRIAWERERFAGAKLADRMRAVVRRVLVFTSVEPKKRNENDVMNKNLYYRESTGLPLIEHSNSTKSWMYRYYLFHCKQMLCDRCYLYD